MFDLVGNLEDMFSNAFLNVNMYSVNLRHVAILAMKYLLAAIMQKPLKVSVLFKGIRLFYSNL